MAEVTINEASVTTFDSPALLGGERRMGDVKLRRFTVAAGSGDTFTYATHELAGVREVAFRHVSGTLGTPAVSATAVTFTGATTLVAVLYIWSKS